MAFPASGLRIVQNNACMYMRVGNILIFPQQRRRLVRITRIVFLLFCFCHGRWKHPAEQSLFMFPQRHLVSAQITLFVYFRTKITTQGPRRRFLQIFSDFATYEIYIFTRKRLIMWWCNISSEDKIPIHVHSILEKKRREHPTFYSTLKWLCFNLFRSYELV